MAAIGTLIDGKYEIVAEIGRGGMSTVYLAMDRRLNKQWAIKEAKQKPGKDSNIYQLTPIAEANLLKSLDHPGIVRIVDIIQQNGYIYIVEDYIEGKSLGEEVKKGPSAPDMVVKWGAQLCDVLDYLHSRNPSIIYRDMKPANVQLLPDKKTIKLLDFGIAKTYKPQNFSDTTNLGTKGYAAPEQFDPKQQSDARTDVFSLGVTLRALLMGKTPHEMEFYEDIRKYNPQVTDGLVKVINKATNQDRNKRYQSAAEFKEALINYHDKDAAVVAFRKKKLASFRGLMISSIAFLLVGCMLLPMAFVARNKDYNTYYEKKDYKQCIQINKRRGEAYEQYLYDLANTNPGQFATSDFRSDDNSGDINYLNISNVNDKKETAAIIIFNYDITREKGKADTKEIFNKENSPKGEAYCIDLVTDFGKNGNDYALDYDADMATELDRCNGDIYKIIATVKLYYYGTQRYVDKLQNEGSIDPSFDVIIDNLEIIKDYLSRDDVKTRISNLDGIVSKASLGNTKYYGSFYEYMVACQVAAIESMKDSYTKVLSETNKKTYIDGFLNRCIDTNSKYYTDQKTQIENDISN